MSWGAKIGDYDDEIQQILDEGKTPVALELSGVADVEGVVDIDHHGDAAISSSIKLIGFSIRSITWVSVADLFAASP